LKEKKMSSDPREK
jgi:hypothetical protein